MEEGRKRVLAIGAGILVARHRKEAACSSRVEHNGVLREREMIYGGAPNNLQGLAGSVGGAFGVNFRMTNSCRRFATAPVAMPIAPFSKVNPAPLRS
jgi:hypothetical protein